jgi:hypothetical protein
VFVTHAITNKFLKSREAFGAEYEDSVGVIYSFEYIII